jgi:Tfp pilus assembly protein PilF
VRGLYYRAWSEARRGIERALQINPRLAVAHHYMGLWLLAKGEFDGALASVRRAQAIEPLALIFSANIGMIYYYARRYEDATAQLQATLAMDSNFDHARSFLGRTYLRLGETERAIEEFQRRRGITMGGVADVAAAHALAGYREEALAALQRLREAAAERYVSGYDVATVYAALGDINGALDALEHSSELPFVELDPALDVLRGEPRFQRIAARNDWNR